MVGNCVTSNSPTFQPMILQPEVGVLAFLVRRGPAGLEVLVQAKPEPGNVRIVQMAPTTQETESNYRRLHLGLATPFIELLSGLNPESVVADIQQSEQGTRFLNKFNRNLVILVDQAEPPSPWWRWFPAESFLNSLRRDFAVNTDVRSVMVSAPWRFWCGKRPPFAANTPELRWPLERSLFCARPTTLSRYKTILSNAKLADRCHEVELERMPGWRFGETSFDGPPDAPVSLKMTRVRTSVREVSNWDQPLMASTAKQHIALVAQVRDGVMLFALRVAAEIGFRNRAEFGPTFQYVKQSGQYLKQSGEQENFGLPQSVVRRWRVRQSDEGGRFAESVVDYSLLQISEETVVPDTAGVVWASLADIEALIAEGGMATNELRSALSLVISLI